MSELDTFFLMTELKRRLSNHLFSDEPESDSFLEDLWCENECNEVTMDHLHNQLGNLIRRYETIIKLRLDDRDE